MGKKKVVKKAVVKKGLKKTAGKKPNKRIVASVPSVPEIPAQVGDAPTQGDVDGFVSNA